MNDPAKQTKKKKGPSMLPALHMNGVAGIAPGNGFKDRAMICFYTILDRHTIFPCTPDRARG